MICAAYFQNGGREVEKYRRLILQAGYAVHPTFFPLIEIGFEAVKVVVTFLILPCCINSYVRRKE
ncbi:hypothetical protein CXP54_14810 [Escherichia albertii]|nr:hypothetical protein CXP54_14810 [Escherichia albertii]PPQ52733.1 hypothetical protein C4623_14715 [Escherichia albertii]